MEELSEVMRFKAEYLYLYSEMLLQAILYLRSSKKIACFKMKSVLISALNDTSMC